ncbi:alcohol dehydrogenase catalytic domain-containing protein [Mycobacterium sp. M26]|uniref:alcohol dehydrogenase catalytic domain-containing protein n=1 Tax=Mycobacterium sp. M26 TaxID=1762962 RepID=UPI00073ED2D5|nr:alcohol dehydrogenase catalytic domain-containing protein [Mycobacterium sp. M26]
MTIEQARIHGPGLVAVDEVELAECGPRDAIVDVHACGICGSDLSFIGMGGLAGPGQPMALGHEFSGVVRTVGAEVTDVSVGQRVVVHPGDDELGRIGAGSPEGGLASAVLVREAVRPGRLFGIPDGISLDVAALAEPPYWYAKPSDPGGCSASRTASRWTSPRWPSRWPSACTPPSASTSGSTTRSRYSVAGQSDWRPSPRWPTGV